MFRLKQAPLQSPLSLRGWSHHHPTLLLQPADLHAAHHAAHIGALTLGPGWQVPTTQPPKPTSALVLSGSVGSKRARRSGCAASTAATAALGRVRVGCCGDGEVRVDGLAVLVELVGYVQGKQVPHEEAQQQAARSLPAQCRPLLVPAQPGGRQPTAFAGGDRSGERACISGRDSDCLCRGQRGPLRKPFSCAVPR
ncbi:hypothetical protein HaLaN_19015 [Haematococcus lacustris]|uniref:Uncharacterized protein n=1 Tax=Haematococcus lacustris TaxID=44745 RepID=A0A699ZZL8_HAELA|nr:hypothetical protein HaLaN_19015 [Haematococcus lacustris]